MANLLLRDNEKEETPLLEKASSIKEPQIVSQVKEIWTRRQPGATVVRSFAGLE
jgi:hypothetical protein